MKRLKVFAHPDGRIDPLHVERGMPPAEDGWWRNVLHDPRAKVPGDNRIPERSGQAFYRLDRHSSPAFTISCECGRSGSFSTRPN